MRLPPATTIERDIWVSPGTATTDVLEMSRDGRSVEHTFTTDAGTWRVRYRVVDAGFIGL
ncbi:MAG: hypothetical protein IRZ16_03495 [Myxococcaceae bacterium]|nr:hypothetical protein [Myxococcaceae bacterium]